LTPDYQPAILGEISLRRAAMNAIVAAVRGNIVICGAASGPADPILPNMHGRKSHTISGVMLTNYLLSPEEKSRRSTDVLNAIAEGWLKLRVDHMLPLSNASRAHELLKSRKSTGKVVLTME
jgi:NADPH:quinone reductase